MSAMKKLPTKDANGLAKGSLNETGSAYLGIPFFSETSTSPAISTEA